jgi:hypothetical protein
LYRDALSSVLCFLTLRELAAALAVNKAWNATVQSMRPAMLVGGTSYAALHGLLSSRPTLRRHVGHIKWGEYTPLSLSPNQWAALAVALPQLRSLSITIFWSADDALLSFPPQLQHFELSVHRPLFGQQFFPTDALLSSIGQLHQLHTLRLRMHFREVSLAPLQQLPLLRDLELVASFPDVERSSAELRALPWLHRLHIDGQYQFEIFQTHYRSLFLALLRDAPAVELQWRDITFDGLEFDDEMASLLTRMPLLERMDGNLARCTRFEFLSTLPRLAQLQLNLFDLSRAAWTNLVGVFTSDGLKGLHTLYLHAGPCTIDDLAQILSHTPSLTSLMLRRLSEVTSLFFFHQLPKLAETLTQLTVECESSRTWDAADLQSLHVLQQLRVLRLLQWPVELTAADRLPFEQRPCSVLPHLEAFEWTPRSQSLNVKRGRNVWAMM